MLLKKILGRVKFPFCKNKELYSSLYEITGFYPNNIRYYKQALHHKSSSLTTEGKRQNNERLEFLGDAILGAIISDLVYHHFEQKKEGFLTNARSNIVKRETLNKIALETGLDKLIVSNTRTSSHNNYMYGNAFEALIGAIYLDQGYQACMKFIRQRIIQPYINIEKMAYVEVNFKSSLIEWAQKKHIDIHFELIAEEKEENGSPFFTTEVFLAGTSIGIGKGYSKKESQQLAAKQALKRIRKTPDMIKKIMEHCDKKQDTSEKAQ